MYVIAVVNTKGGVGKTTLASATALSTMKWGTPAASAIAVINVHLKGTWVMCHHAIKMMRGQRSGRIVNFSSDTFKGSVGQTTGACSRSTN